MNGTKTKFLAPPKKNIFRAKEKRLASLQSRIWFLHDEKKFKELGEAASELFSLLGFSKRKSMLAGKYTVDAQYFYKAAGEEGKKGNDKRKDYYFKKALKEQIKIRELLGEDVRAAYYENRWWREFQHKNYLGVILYIFRQQIVMYKGYNFLIPLRTTYYLIKAGLEGHNKRKIDVAAKYLEKYWEISLKHMKDKIQY